MIDVPVLIVGGGPVGLSASILLSRLGIPSRLVERRPSTALHPKARNINMRTMEIFRQCGVEDGVRAAGLPITRSASPALCERKSKRSSLCVPGVTQPSCTSWSEAEKVLIAIADALHHRATLSDAEFTLLKAHYDEAKILEIIQLCGFYRTVSYLANALALPLEEGAARFPV